MRIIAHYWSVTVLHSSFVRIGMHLLVLAKSQEQKVKAFAWAGIAREFNIRNIRLY